MYGLVLLGLFSVGNVDSIDGNLAYVEFEFDGTVNHEHVLINKSICMPKEGQMVLVSNKKIIFCIK